MILLSFIKKYWISLFLSLVIIVLCFMNTEPMPDVPMTNFDKLVHFLMFLGLSGTIFFENSSYFKKQVSYQRIVWGSFFFPTVFSGLIELMQEYVSPYRTGDWMDFLYDAIGAFVGLAICMKINSRLKIEE
ncbi:VanZ family protein [Bacteroidales bacterium OttesenSCG-928-M06]|nr:VanZ family protein [Bacteroidales bacterium OttesenSCG-928-M06]